MKKRWIIPLALTVFLMTLTSFAIWFLKGNDKPTIIVVVQRLDIEYWKIFESGAQKAFRDLNIDGEVLAPDVVNPIYQAHLLKNVLQKQPDALIVNPIDSSLTISELTEFKKENIPVLFVSRDVEWENKTAYIGTDHDALGEMAGKLLGSMLQPGDQSAIIYGTSDDQAMIDRKNGARKVLEAIGVEVVTEKQGYNHVANPIPVMGNILQLYPNIKGVVATSDRLALEALKTIEEEGFTIPVIGTDGIIEMTEFIEAGKTNASIAQNPYDMGYLSVVQAQKVINGVHIEKKTDSGIDIITQENAKRRLIFLKLVLR